MKSFLNGFLSVFLTLATIILFISISIDNVISSNISDLLSKEKIKDYVVNYIIEIFPDKANEIYNIKDQLEENKTIDEITDDYYDTLIYDIKNDTVSDIKINKKLNSLITDIESNNNFSTNEKQYINSKLTNDNFNDLYHLILEEIKNMLDDNNLLKISKYLVNPILRNALIIINIFLCIMLIIINRSLIKTLMNIGIDLIITGITGSIIFPISIKYIENIVGNSFNIDIDVNIINLLKPGLIIGIIGLICIFINIIYYRIKNKK